MAQSGLPCHVMPSCSAWRRIISTSDLRIGSSPTTHITSSTMLSSGTSSMVAVSFFAALVLSLSPALRAATPLRTARPRFMPALAVTPTSNRAAIKQMNVLYALFIVCCFRMLCRLNGCSRWREPACQPPPCVSFSERQPTVSPAGPDSRQPPVRARRPCFRAF